MPILSNAFARFHAQHCAKESLSALPREGPIRPQATATFYIFYLILIAPACARRSHTGTVPLNRPTLQGAWMRLRWSPLRPFVTCGYSVVSWMWCAAAKALVPLRSFGIGAGCLRRWLQLSPVSATSSVHTVFVTDCGGAHDLMAEVIAYSFVRSNQVRAWPP